MLSTGSLQHLISTYGYWAVGGIVALESMGLPLPGEATLIAAALYAGATHELEGGIELLVTQATSFSKGIIFDRFRPFMGNGLVMSEGAFHLRQRRLMQPAFHGARLAAYADTMVRATGELTGTWRAGEVRRLDADMQRLAITVVGETLFATELGRKAVAEARRSIPVVLKAGMVRALSPRFLEHVPVIPANRRFDQAVDRLRRIVHEVIAGWRVTGEDHGVLLSMLMLARDPGTGEGMTDHQVYDEVVTLLTAGSETSAVALTWLFHELARNPEVERRVRAEVDEVLAGRRRD